jgi:perosamine synthetase
MRKINFWETDINLKDYRQQKKIFSDNFPNEGKFTNILEKKISKLLKIKHCIAVANGTSALYIALKIINIKKDDEVIIPNMTFPATANAVRMTEGKVVLVDLDIKTLNIDIKDLEKKITKKTKAIIPVHVSGRPCNLGQILNIAKKRKIKIIEDAAEAFLSSYKNKFLGTLGDIGCFSLSPNKIFTSGQGGLIVTNNEKYNKLIRLFKNQGRFGLPTGGDDNYICLGGNFKLSNISSGLALSELEKVNSRSKRLIKNYKLYNKLLKNIKEIKVIKFNLKYGELPLWVDIICDRRDELFNYLKNKNIICRKFWNPLSSNNLYSQQKHNTFKNTLIMQNKLMWLPSSFLLKDRDIIDVVRNIEKFYSLNPSF